MSANTSLYTEVLGRFMNKAVKQNFPAGKDFLEEGREAVVRLLVPHFGKPAVIFHTT